MFLWEKLKAEKPNQSEGQNPLLPSLLLKTSRVRSHPQRGEHKRVQWPLEKSTASWDWAESTLSWDLTRGRHCHQSKIGSCHSSRWHLRHSSYNQGYIWGKRAEGGEWGGDSKETAEEESTILKGFHRAHATYIKEALIIKGAPWKDIVVWFSLWLFFHFSIHHCGMLIHQFTICLLWIDTVCVTRIFLITLNKRSTSIDMYIHEQNQFWNVPNLVRMFKRVPANHQSNLWIEINTKVSWLIHYLHPC